MEIYECSCIPCKPEAVGKEGHFVCQTFLEGAGNLCSLGRGLWKGCEIWQQGHTKGDNSGHQNYTEPPKCWITQQPLFLFFLPLITLSRRVFGEICNMEAPASENSVNKRRRSNRVGNSLMTPTLSNLLIALSIHIYAPPRRPLRK